MTHEHTNQDWRLQAALDDTRYYDQQPHPAITLGAHVPVQAGDASDLHLQRIVATLDNALEPNRADVLPTHAAQTSVHLAPAVSHAEAASAPQKEETE